MCHSFELARAVRFGMVTIESLRTLVAREHGLAVVSTTRRDRSVSNSVVNCGLLPHPVDAEEVLGFVVRGDAMKLRRIRRDPRLTVTFRAGWEWVSAEGPAEIAGPEDALDGLDPEEVPVLLRDVFMAAGGTHDDWATYDRVMRDERRAAVLVRVTRLIGVMGA